MDNFLKDLHRLGGFFGHFLLHLLLMFLECVAYCRITNADNVVYNSRATWSSLWNLKQMDSIFFLSFLSNCFNSSSSLKLILSSISVYYCRELLLHCIAPPSAELHKDLRVLSNGYTEREREREKDCLFSCLPHPSNKKERSITRTRGIRTRERERERKRERDTERREKKKQKGPGYFFVFFFGAIQLYIGGRISDTDRDL